MSESNEKQFSKKEVEEIIKGAQENKESISVGIIKGFFGILFFGALAIFAFICIFGYFAMQM